MINPLKALKYASFLDNVMLLVPKQKYAEAMIEMNKLYDLFKCTKPSEKMPLQANIFLALVAFRVGNFDLSIEASRTALRQLAQPGKKLGDQNQHYLSNYCNELLAYCLESKAPTSSDGQFPMMEVDLSAVRADLKRKFPWTPRAAIDHGGQVACP